MGSDFCLLMRITFINELIFFVNGLILMNILHKSKRNYNKYLEFVIPHRENNSNYIPGIMIISFNNLMR